MAVDLIMGYRSESFTSKMEENSVEEAASAGLESVEKLIRLLSETQQQYERSPKSAMEIDVDYKSVTDLAVNKFKKVISLLGRTRTGHARFRRGPLSLPYHTSPSSCVSPPPPPSQLTHESIHPKQENINMNISISNQCSGSRVYCPTPIQRLPPLPPPVPCAPSHQHQHHHHHQNFTNSNPIMMESSKTISFTSSPPISTTTTSFMSSLTGETESKQPSCGRPPLSTKRKCSSVDEGGPKCAGGHGRCHCSKRRKSRVKRVVRVPAISLKMSDIPPDDFSWRKYGQKPIKGSPHPRGYYKCSSMKFCPARKHVERALDDPAMLIVTYDGEHNHSKSVTDTASLILESS